uniref:SANT domain-containing protein n=1 Tax=Oryza meridionalis TaxID=40149 RepID=A0A0E0BYJ0_9ORYZ
MFLILWLGIRNSKRKMSDLGPQWSKDELMRFYEAYRRHGKNWKKVSASVGGKSADTVEALYSVHRDESKSHKGSDQTVRASGKVRKREATGQKEKEAPHAHRSYHERRTSGLSSFKKRYYGDKGDPKPLVHLEGMILHRLTEGRKALQLRDPNKGSKLKRKMSDLGPQWSKDELMRFYEAYRRHGKNWKKVSASVGGKSADTVEALYSVHRDESKSHKGSDQTVRASGKVRKREATGQKEKEAPHAHRSYHERRTSGLSSFKKRYYGGH